MKLSAKIFTPKGQFRFVYIAYVNEADFPDVEIQFSKIIQQTFGACQYQIFQIEQLW